MLGIYPPSQIIFRENLITTCKCCKRSKSVRCLQSNEHKYSYISHPPDSRTRWFQESAACPLLPWTLTPKTPWNYCFHTDLNTTLGRLWFNSQCKGFLTLRPLWKRHNWGCSETCLNKISLPRLNLISDWNANNLKNNNCVFLPYNPILYILNST